MDALQTKIAVDLQNLDVATRDEQLAANISELPEAAGADCAFLVLIDATGEHFESVFSACQGFAQCSPDVLQGDATDAWPWLLGRLGHLKVVEVDDTLKAPKRARDELARLLELKIGSILYVGISVRGEIAGFLGLANERAVDTWDANAHLLIKLIGASLASGLERLHDRYVLAELMERQDLVAQTANDGIWDFDGRTKHIELSPRWKRMLGYREDDDEVILDWYHLVHPDDMARVQAQIRDLQAELENAKAINVRLQGELEKLRQDQAREKAEAERVRQEQEAKTDILAESVESLESALTIPEE
ncbi:MAG: PAS domain-containing protein, partial [Woeseiaceae bacterium]|nr:PAS domain-containing protein [Woeseiaceae bacterium]